MPFCRRKVRYYAMALSSSGELHVNSPLEGWAQNRELTLFSVGQIPRDVLRGFLFSALGPPENQPTGQTAAGAGKVGEGDVADVFEITDEERGTLFKFKAKFGCYQ